MSSKRRSNALLWVITFVVALETTILHLILGVHHPYWAWAFTLASLSLLPVVWTRLRLK